MIALLRSGAACQAAPVYYRKWLVRDKTEYYRTFLANYEKNKDFFKVAVPPPENQSRTATG